MDDTILDTVLEGELKPERPRLYKAILLNDDYTPRDFVVRILRSEFRLSEQKATSVMYTAHQRGSCVVGVFTKDIAEAKVTAAIDLARKNGFPLLFTSEPEE